MSERHAHACHRASDYRLFVLREDRTHGTRAYLPRLASSSVYRTCCPACGALSRDRHRYVAVRPAVVLATETENLFVIAALDPEAVGGGCRISSPATSFTGVERLQCLALRSLDAHAMPGGCRPRHPFLPSPRESLMTPNGSRHEGEGTPPPKAVGAPLAHRGPLLSAIRAGPIRASRRIRAVLKC
jgi:hypothetical protein